MPFGIVRAAGPDNPQLEDRAEDGPANGGRSRVDFEFTRDFANKFPSQLARLILIFHAADAGDDIKSIAATFGSSLTGAPNLLAFWLVAMMARACSIH